MIDNETTPSDEIATFKVSNPAKVSSISLSPEKVPAGTSQPVTVTVKGTNLDIRSETTIRLLHLNESTPISGYPPIPVSPTPENETEFTATITQKPGGVSACIVAVYFKEAKQGKGKWLYLYGFPEITSVTIPKAGTSYAPNKLPVTIKGKNFNAPDIRFNGSGAVFTNFKVMSDTLATAKIECPSTAQTTEVTVTCKTSIGTSSKKSSLSITDFVTDHNRDYRTGKIVLADKTLINKESYTEINESNPPVGIVCTVYGVPRILALHISNRLRWDNNVYNGYGTHFEDIVCTPGKTQDGAAETATFTGDTDGSDNWNCIKLKNPTRAVNAAAHYPAFDWVNTYNTTYAAQLGSANLTWYMPTVAELCEVYKNRTAINEILAVIHALKSTYADQSLGRHTYWSSSQCSNRSDDAWNVGFYRDGYLTSDHKFQDLRVCCMAGF